MSTPTDDQLRIALAKAMGWKQEYHKGSECSEDLGGPDYVNWVSKNGLEELPPLDHNTLAHVRHKLLTTPHLKRHFLFCLRLEIGSQVESSPYEDLDLGYQCVDATPRQQAIALLRSMGKEIE